MKFNKKSLLALFVLFIVAFSISCVSAEDVVTDDVTDVSLDDTIDVVAPVATTTHNVANGANATTIQGIVDNATAGDTISFATNGNYIFGNNEVIKVTKTLIFLGNNATITCQNGFDVAATKTPATSIKGTCFDSFIFNGTSTTWNGRAINMAGAENTNITNCKFLGSTNAGIYLKGCVGGILVANNYFNGTTNVTSVNNKGSNEIGTKCINIMGGVGVTVKNNVFEGPVLDGVSIASNSKNILVDNNTIDGAYYGIFYGGGLEYITMTNNTMKDIKCFAITLMKAAQTSTIVNNTIIMGKTPEGNPDYPDNAAIYLAQGNTAHGAATKIGNDTIVDNKFLIGADVPANQTVYAIKIISENGPLKLNGFFLVENNTYGDNVNKFIFIDQNWNYDDGNMNASQYTMETNLTAEENDVTVEMGDNVLIQLTGADGTVLPNQAITLNIMKNSTVISTKNLITNKFGIITFVNNLDAGIYQLNANFAGSTYNGGLYTASTLTINLNSTNPSKKIVPVISANHLVKYYLNDSHLIVKLTDNGKGLANENVLIFINGVKYNRVTDENGTATMGIYLRPGVYNITLAFLGNNKYETCVAADQITVLSTIVAESITMTDSKRIPFRATIYNPNGTLAIGQSVDLNVNGVIYHRTADENGTVELKIWLLPKDYILTVYQKIGEATLAQSFNITITKD